MKSLIFLMAALMPGTPDFKNYCLAGPGTRGGIGHESF